MRADITRMTFDATKRFAGVVHQQQRVLLDADLNEQHDIVDHRIERLAIDALGAAATPVDGLGVASGFELTVAPAGDDLLIGAGTFHAGGMTCEMPRTDAPVRISAQPDLPASGSPMVPAPGASMIVPAPGTEAATHLVALDANGVPVAPADGVYVGFLDAWRRHVGPLEDDAIREVALGGPDTATRLKTMAQVKLLQVDSNAGLAATCASDFVAWSDHRARLTPTGRMAARAEPTSPPKGPCALSPRAGYRRLENQLYRVEVLEPSTAGSGATATWSRDNGAVAVRCLAGQSAGLQIKVTTLGRDAVLAIAPGQWVELVDDVHDALGRRGQVLKVVKAEDDVVTVASAANLPAFRANPRLRRWDGVVAVKSTWTLLEDGVEIRFDGGTHLEGDYWLVPARTLTGNVEWPRSPAGPLFVPRHGTAHVLCKLAVLRCVGGYWTLLEDCRPKFPAATDHVALHYQGGDGQEATPNPANAAQRILLSSPLVVGVSNGRWPVAGAKVRFTVTGGSGVIGPSGLATDDLITGADGVVECPWSLDGANATQTVEAILLGGTPLAPRGLPVRFSARLLRAAEISYDPAACAGLAAAGVRTVQAAIDRLCQEHGGGCCELTVGEGGRHATLFEALKEAVSYKRADVCICLLPGTHAIGNWYSGDDFTEMRNQLRRTHLRIAGCGRATRVSTQEVPLILRQFASVTLADFDVSTTRTASVIEIADCGDVTLRRLHVTSAEMGDALVRVSRVVRFRCVESSIENFMRRAIDLPAEVLRGINALKGLLGDSATIDSVLLAAGAVASRAELEGDTAPYRLALGQRIAEGVAYGQQEGSLDEREAEAFMAVVRAYQSAAIDVAGLGVGLVRLREVLSLANPTTALIVEGVGGDVTLDACQFVGDVGIDGTDYGKTRIEDLEKTAGPIWKLKRRLGRGLHRLELHRSRFQGLVAGTDVLIRDADVDGVFEVAFARAVVNDNAFTSPRVALVAARILMSCDVLVGDKQSGVAIAHAAACTGLIGEGGTLLFLKDSADPLVQHAALVDLSFRVRP